MFGKPAFFSIYGMEPCLCGLPVFFSGPTSWFGKQPEGGMSHSSYGGERRNIYSGTARIFTPPLLSQIWLAVHAKHRILFAFGCLYTWECFRIGTPLNFNLKLKIYKLVSGTPYFQTFPYIWFPLLPPLPNSIFSHFFWEGAPWAPPTFTICFFPLFSPLLSAPIHAKSGHSLLPSSSCGRPRCIPSDGGWSIGGLRPPNGPKPSAIVPILWSSTGDAFENKMLLWLMQIKQQCNTVMLKVVRGLQEQPTSSARSALTLKVYSKVFPC